MQESFWQIVIFVSAAFVLGVGLPALSIIIQKVFDIGCIRPIKATEYECGVKAIGQTQTICDIKYYLFALLFLVFDVEFVFLLPWALSLHSFPQQSLFFVVEALLFVAILGLGWFYALRSKALEWQ